MSGNRGATVVLVGFAGVLLVLAGVSAWQGTARLTGRGAERDQVKAAARAFVRAYGTFDYRDPGGYRERLLVLSTGSLHAAVATSDIDPVALAQSRMSSTWVVSVDVTSLAGGQATASVVADHERGAVDPISGHERWEAVRQRVTCRLARVDGRWLVAEFRLLGEEQPGLRTGN